MERISRKKIDEINNPAKYQKMNKTRIKGIVFDLDNNSVRFYANEGIRSCC